MMKSAILLLAIIFASSVSAVKFKGNITMNGNANGWDYRRSAVTVIPIPPIISYASVDVDSFRSGREKQFNVSAIQGGGIFAYGQYPFAYLASGQGAWDRSGNNGNGNGNGNGNHDFSLALNYIATSYLRIEEKSPNGTVVASSSLRNTIPFDPSTDRVKWALDYVQPNDGTISAASIVGTPQDGSSWSINITFIAASVVGVIDLAQAVVGPSSFEQIVQINNYQYQSTDNHLSLVMYTASGSLNADSSSSSMTTLVSGSGSSQVYFSASNSAIVNGKTSTVNVNVAVASSTDDDVRGLSDIFTSQLVAKFGSAASYHRVTVDFAAGAQAIAYDPSQGAGSQLPASGSSTSSASSVVASVSLFVLALVALLL